MAGCSTRTSSLHFDCDVPIADYADSRKRSFGVTDIESRSCTNDPDRRDCCRCNVGIGSYQHSVNNAVISGRIEDLVARDGFGSVVTTNEIIDFAAADHSPYGHDRYHRIVRCA